MPQTIRARRGTRFRARGRVEDVVSRRRAQRIRFGILAARHHHQPGRLTPWQVEYLEGCAAVGWRVRDSVRAYKREAAKC